MEALPRQLRRQRHIRGWTQGETGRRAHLSRQVISEIERGVCRDLRLTTILSLCQAFEISPDQMTGYDREWPKDGACERCGGVLSGQAHRVADCIVEMHYAGVDVGKIASRMEFTVVSIETILREERAA